MTQSAFGSYSKPSWMEESSESQFLPEITEVNLPGWGGAIMPHLPLCFFCSDSIMPKENLLEIEDLLLTTEGNGGLCQTNI